MVTTREIRIESPVQVERPRFGVGLELVEVVRAGQGILCQIDLSYIWGGAGGFRTRYRSEC